MKKILACILVFCLVGSISMTAMANGFSDVPETHWAHDAIMELKVMGIISGDGHGAFRPDDNITREAFLKMIISAFDVETGEAELTFEDVEAGAWYEQAVMTGVAAGIVNGKNHEEFGIGDIITRQDACVMLRRVLGVDTAENVSFADEADISDYAVDSVLILAGHGVVSGAGDGLFRPKDHCTRAQAAMIILNAGKLSLEEGGTDTEETPAKILGAAFDQIASEEPLAIAEKLVANPVIPFMGGAVPVVPGLLTGFGEEEISGFSSGAMFAPMIGTIPFVGYVFETEDEESAKTLGSTLEDKANLRWNICTAAEEKLAVVKGNKVFFVMSPLSFEE